MRALRIGLILLVILGGLAFAADRVAVGMAEGEIASKVRSSQGLDSEPSVSIKGFPFLTQLVGKKLDRVDLEMDTYTVQVDDQTGTVDDLVIRLDDVKLENNYERAVAARASGGGVISYAEMARLTGDGDSTFGVSFGYAGEGQIEVRVTVMGRAVGPTMIGDLDVDGDLVSVSIDDIPSFSDIPVIGSIPGIEDQIRQRVDQDRQISGLPSGVELEGLKATEDGVTLSVAGTDVQLTGAASE
ncbi:LmeA family phospholipid-binding protein [Streptomyces otsuchiensis]|uniref:LmeA family phospholipid-binding protein n=1 Tax=Streptomyces otsuchiensis TaxID=2681388 RepID=UPI0010305FF0|nr:DUF2993 domain-containing protein [Streptomyces otsuchiensis]